ncbi:COG0702 Predicted nucleoside-diphosphate-sugar epimerases [Methylophilaceae bacterium]|jgi:NADH dehydrogenase
MHIKHTVVLGGSGFVGSAIVAKLVSAGYQVTVLTRRLDHAKHLSLLPGVTLKVCNVFDAQALRSALQGADAVINLLGILHQSGKVSFTQVHEHLPVQLAKLCQDLGIKRLLHMSSLCAATDAPSLYLRSKGQAEVALASYAKGLAITVFRPSIIFGRADQFINLFAGLIKHLPLVVLVKPNAKFQPVWVEDVATCFVASLNQPASFGLSYDLVGPKVYTFRALLKAIMQTLGVHKPILGLNDVLSYAQAFLMECLPIKLMSRDNIRSMQVDSVSDQAFPEWLELRSSALETVMPQYLIDQTPRGAYDRFRRKAAR